MIPFLRYTLAASYLFAQEAQPLRTWSAAEARGAALLLLGILLAWRWDVALRHKGRSPLAARVTGGALAATLFFLAVRFHARGPLSPRIWWLSSLVVALLTPSLYWLAHRRWSMPLRLLGRALAGDLSLDDPPLPPKWRLALFLLHVGGLLLLARHPELRAWPALSALACLGITSWKARRPRWEVLTPLLLAYAASALHVLVTAGIGVDVAPYASFAYPNLWAPLFVPRIFFGASLLWTAYAAATLLGRHGERRWLGGLWLLGVAWYVAGVIVHRSRGVSGSDPFCYLQMATDLVERDTPLHPFPLAALARELGIATWPTVPVGYHPPTDGPWAATVWPIGWPLLLAPFYALGGEGMALWAAPCFALLAAWLTARLAQELSSHEGRETAWIGGLAALILLTSPESILRALVPMADAAAQALSLLTIWCLLRARHRDHLTWSALAGASLALSYTVRHPQLPLGLAAMPALLLGAPPRRCGLHLACFGGMALLCALPDLAYHALVFGSPWAVESPEGFLLGWRNIGASLGHMLRDGLLRPREFGYLLPLAIYGLLHSLRLERDDATSPDRELARRHVVLLVGFLGVLFLHLSYAALRFRDLIPLFPWLALWGAAGMVALWRGATTTRRRILVVGLAAMALAARTAPTLTMPWDDAVWTFGYVTAEQRSAYARLADVLPEDAVIATGLNSGAVGRYTGRATVRPAAWTPAEFARLAEALARRGRSLYLLDDGEEMAAFIAALYREVVYLGSYPLPRFGLGGQRLEGPNRLYRLP